MPRIDILDVWGEGRIRTKDGLITGFSQAWNINKRGQKVSNGPDSGKAIPNLLLVEDYDDPKFPVADNSVLYITVMGSPITPTTAKEMYRVLDKKKGVVILYGIDKEHVINFESNKRELILKPKKSLGKPFNEPNIKGEVRIYAFTDPIGHVEL